MEQALRDLYQEVIVDHNRNPRHYGACENFSTKAEGFNPLCGDQLTLYLEINNKNIIENAMFTGHGCAISTASASLMTDAVIGKTQAEAEQLFEKFHQALVDKDAQMPASVGKLAVLGGVKTFPARIKCATLAWHTLSAALTHKDDIVTTE